MRDMLEAHGYRTEIFASGSSFWDAYSPGRRGCLLADARMPGIGGLEFIERLNKMQASLPVIMITAYGDIAIAVKAMKAGAFDFLQKPANPKELLDCIERALYYSPDTLSTLQSARLQRRKSGASRLASVKSFSSFWPATRSKNIARTCGLANAPWTTIAPRLCGKPKRNPCPH